MQFYKKLIGFRVCRKFRLALSGSAGCSSGLLRLVKEVV